ncbi:hypothetical protein B7Z00_00075 [Candidatus Saccharibacteria bacterium 32-50-10]|nr:MAG: hypothetical protein B7Z00_00075 [Candidatus Saccharibacteria bacterium 32-50-10]
MKKSDIAMIILIAGVGVIIAYFIAVNIPFLKLPENGMKVQTVRELKSEVSEPSEDVFNAEAINPTVEVVVGSGGAE